MQHRSYTAYLRFTRRYRSRSQCQLLICVRSVDGNDPLSIQWHTVDVRTPTHFAVTLIPFVTPPHPNDMPKPTIAKWTAGLFLLISLMGTPSGLRRSLAQTPPPSLGYRQPSTLEFGSGNFGATCSTTTCPPMIDALPGYYNAMPSPYPSGGQTLIHGGTRWPGEDLSLERSSLPISPPSSAGQISTLALSLRSGTLPRIRLVGNVLVITYCPE